MQKLTLKIDTKSNKGKYLVGLIRELAKDSDEIEIVSNETMHELRSSLQELKAGKRKSIDQLLK